MIRRGAGPKDRSGVLAVQLGRGLLAVGRVEVEVDAAERPLSFGLAEDHRDVAVERDAVAHVGAAGQIGVDRLLQERPERGLAIVGKLLQAHDVAVIALERDRQLGPERIDGEFHTAKIRRPGSK